MFFAGQSCPTHRRLLSRYLELKITRQFSTISTATLNNWINKSLQNGNLDTARRLFGENPMSRNTFSNNIIMKGYFHSGRIGDARVLFDKMPVRDIVKWNTFLSGLCKQQDHDGVYRCYLELRRSRILPNEYTLPMVIMAILRTGFDGLILQLHAQMVHWGLCSSVFVGSALMKSYTYKRDLKALNQVFDEVLEKDVTSWNALICGYMELGLVTIAERCFNVMPEKNVVSWTTMVYGYVKNKQIGIARDLFNKMEDKNVVSWTTMICGYVQLNLYSSALEMFISMMESGTRPNQHTFSSVLDACAGSSSLVIGKQVHASIVKHGIPGDTILSTALVDMYAKCGDINAAHGIFEFMPKANVALLNALMGGYAIHGMATKAIEMLYGMLKKGDLRPDHITFVNILSACVHSGLVDEGEKIFSYMESVCCIRPRNKHYASMVDLYGRAGYLDKAVGVIMGMPFMPDVVVWGALLSACGLHSEFELGKQAADAIHLFHHPAVYSVMSKILGEKGAWNTAIELRNSMKQKGAKKQKAGSWIN
ncbi:hypothetical protein Droror1_Dr00025364 [Drosera rotundifolia]